MSCRGSMRELKVAIALPLIRLFQPRSSCEMVRNLPLTSRRMVSKPEVGPRASRLLRDDPALDAQPERESDFCADTLVNKGIASVRADGDYDARVLNAFQYGEPQKIDFTVPYEFFSRRALLRRTVRKRRGPCAPNHGPYEAAEKQHRIKVRQ